MSLLNTHSKVKEFIESGISEEQTELIMRAINQVNNNLITKSDLRTLIKELKSEISKTNTALHNQLNWKKLIAFYIITFLIKITILSGMCAIWMCT